MKKPSIGVVLLLEIVVFVVLFLLNVLMNGGSQMVGQFAIFIDLPSLLSIFLCVAPALLVSGMGRDFLHAFSLGKKEYSLRELKKSLEAVKMVQLLVICGAMIAAIISFCSLLYSMEDLATLGPCLVVITLSVFYATVLEFLLIPLKAHVQNAITDLMGVEDEEA